LGRSSRERTSPVTQQRSLARGKREAARGTNATRCADATDRRRKPEDGTTRRAKREAPEGMSRRPLTRDGSADAGWKLRTRPARASPGRKQRGHPDLMSMRRMGPPPRRFSASWASHVGVSDRGSGGSWWCSWAVLIAEVDGGVRSYQPPATVGAGSSPEARAGLALLPSPTNRTLEAGLGRAAWRSRGTVAGSR